MVQGAWPGAGRWAECVRAWFGLTGTELGGRERSRRLLPEVGTGRAGCVLVGLRVGVLAARELPRRELAWEVLLLVLAARLGSMRRGSLGELPSTVLPVGLLPGPLRPSHWHSGGASVWRGWSIRVAALREWLLRLRTMRARLSLLLTMGTRCGILAGTRRLRLALPAGFWTGRARPERR